MSDLQQNVVNHTMEYYSATEKIQATTRMTLENTMLKPVTNSATFTFYKFLFLLANYIFQILP